MRSILFFVCFLFLLVSQVSSAQEDIHAFITRDSITIGDQFELWIQANVSPEEFNWVSEETDLGGLEIISKGEFVNRSDAQTDGFEQKLILQAWEEGIQWIPQLGYLIGQDSFKTDSIMVPVYPIQLDTNQLTVLPDKGLRTAEFEWRELKKYWWVPLLILVIGALVFYLVSRSKNKAKEEKIVLAHEWAFSELAELKAQKLPETGDLKRFYSGLSYILRAYLEKRYAIQALEKTTREIMRSPIRSIIDANEQKKLRQGLEIMDLVKFAKYRPDQDQHDTAWQKIYDFVDMTKENPVINQEGAS